MNTAQIGCRTWSRRLRTWSLSCLGNPRTLMVMWVMSYTEQVRGVLLSIISPLWLFVFVHWSVFLQHTASHKLLVRDHKEYFWAVCRVSKWSVLLDLLTLPLAFHFAWHGNCKGWTRYKAQSIPPTHTNPTLAWANKAAKKLKKGGVKRYEKIKDWMK